MKLSDYEGNLNISIDDATIRFSNLSIRKKQYSSIDIEVLYQCFPPNSGNSGYFIRKTHSLPIDDNNIFFPPTSSDLLDMIGSSFEKESILLYLSSNTEKKHFISTSEKKDFFENLDLLDKDKIGISHLFDKSLKSSISTNNDSSISPNSFFKIHSLQVSHLKNQNIAYTNFYNEIISVKKISTILNDPNDTYIDVDTILTISEDGKTFSLYKVTPDNSSGTPGLTKKDQCESLGDTWWSEIKKKWLNC